MDSLAAPKLHNVRFSLDAKKIRSQGSELDSGDRLKAFAHLQHLKITASVTPFLRSSLDIVLERLEISVNKVDAFVYNSHEIQAECFSLADGKCVLRFSSTLIDILSDEEFQFVIGHELGHFIYDHQGISNNNGELTIRQLKASRYQEISADRIALIACGSLEIAIKALIKSSSGLTSKHLRYDVGTYLNQLRLAKNHSSIFEEYSTHPSAPLRCKALVWFSMVNQPLTMNERTLVREMKSIDEKVGKDLAKYSEENTYKLSQEISVELNFWKDLESISAKGSLTKDDQAKLEESYGQEMLDKVIGFIQGKSPSEVIEHTRSKVLRYQQELHELGY